MVQRKNPKTHSKKEAKTQPVDNKNGKRTGGGGEGDARGDAQGGPKYSMFTWIVVLGLLGVWSSVAIVYFDIVDYDSVIGGPQPLCKNLLWFQASLHGCPLEK